MWHTAVLQLREVLKQPFVSGSQHVASEHPYCPRCFAASGIRRTVSGGGVVCVLTYSGKLDLIGALSCTNTYPTIPQLVSTNVTHRDRLNRDRTVKVDLRIG